MVLGSAQLFMNIFLVESEITVCDSFLQMFQMSAAPQKLVTNTFLHWTPLWPALWNNLREFVNITIAGKSIRKHFTQLYKLLGTTVKVMQTLTGGNSYNGA